MRQGILLSVCTISALSLSACGETSKVEVERAVQDVLASDEAGLNDIMMSAADPNEAVTYFRRSLQDAPNKIEAQRGLAASLVRAKRNTEAASAWAKVAAHPQAKNEDKVSYADALIRSGDWAKAEKVLDGIPPTHETYKRYRLEAMIADSKKQWDKADSFYETAAGLTTTPGGVLNNWGYSKLTRGDYRGAERLFVEALTYDPKLFTAKNNLALARGAQRNYSLPVIEMSRQERAQLYYTLALTAVKQGDVATGRGLLQDAIEASPQHYEEAVRALDALETQG